MPCSEFDSLDFRLTCRYCLVQWHANLLAYKKPLGESFQIWFLPFSFLHPTGKQDCVEEGAVKMMWEGQEHGEDAGASRRRSNWRLGIGYIWKNKLINWGNGKVLRTVRAMYLHHLKQYLQRWKEEKLGSLDWGWRFLSMSNDRHRDNDRSM